MPARTVITANGAAIIIDDGGEHIGAPGTVRLTIDDPEDGVSTVFLHLTPAMQLCAAILNTVGEVETAMGRSAGAVL